MWPLDVGMAALAGLVLYIVWKYLSFDDPRILHNRWAYLIAVPLITIVLSVGLHFVASQFVKKSIQVGFLFSTIVHLLLLILAVQLVIFPHYFPEAFAGVKRERSPIRKTVPEYLFEKPEETETVTPDWSRPVDTETTSRVVPREDRQMPPLSRSAPQLEMPKPREQPTPSPQKFLMQRPEPESSEPKPAEAPSKLARQRIQRETPTMPTEASPEAPRVQSVPLPNDEVAQADRASAAARSDRPRTNPTTSMAAAAPDLPQREAAPSPTPAIRQLADAMPQVGTSGLSRQRSQRRRPDQAPPAGSAPAPPAVAVARLDVSAERMVAPTDTPIQRRSDAVGAQLSAAAAQSTVPAATAQPEVTAGNLPQRSEMASMAGRPEPSLDPTERSRPRSTRRRGRSGQGQAVGDAPSIGAIAEMLADATGESEAAGPSSDDLAERSMSQTPRQGKASGETEGMPDLAVTSDPILDLIAPQGEVGLAREFAENAGMLPSDEPTEMASMDLSRQRRKRRQVGGPITPAGTAIAAVEQFSRRVQRTKGGAAPAPAGMVGPETEEAIELGLAYLASTQQEDGSWSLQGHGEEVVLRSDTAATGMCLLAFQGAGYTHRQHQYASVVAKGLKFLLKHQKSNGDLYRLEDPTSNQNVALYSHGIASLALCEAYGMTQDPELKEPAQQCIDYIAATQHRRRGGWRYTPQVSSDTSVTGWMMMAVKSGELSGLNVSPDVYEGIDRWLSLAKLGPARLDRYVYNPFAPDTPQQVHGRLPTPTMTSVGILMRMYSGWSRENPDMQSAADYILEHPPRIGTREEQLRDTYYWYYATQVMFHMGGDYWKTWSGYLTPVLIDSQIKRGPQTGSWDPEFPVPDRWSPHGGRLYVSAMNLLNLEVYYRHLPIYEETAGDE
ncbi:prenyltransferase/squalene oxidase repeat-containing protein [Allorhodopirellula solitaria]|nr:prenyltransferase/squalene oxidase repeat-containing protein [Allorhodopirellula solitaria]